MMTNAAPLNDIYSQLKTARAPWETLWQEIGAFVIPRRQVGLGGTILPSTEKESRLFDTTAGRAAEVLANGQLAWMSPMETAWFAFTTEHGRGSEEAKRYLSSATAIARAKLSGSNFYTSIHEFYMDRGVFGTGALFLEEGQNFPLNVQYWPVGSFAIDTNYEGYVDTVYRQANHSLGSLVKRWGKEKLSPKLQEKFATGKEGLFEVAVVTSIFPRTREEMAAGRTPQEKMPVACVVWEYDSHHIIEQTGYQEMPVFVSRYLEWGSVFGSFYGWSPAFLALPEARQVNFLQKMMDALAEKMAFPPMLAPDELEGEIDPNANGVTYFSQDIAGRLPRPLQENQRYDIGLSRIQERQDAINKAFHVDLFNMYASLDKQMTAREVAAREAEKLIQFSPTFARLTTELFTPCLQRLFAIGYRAGWFGQAPASMKVPTMDGGESVDMPAIEYSSRIALALRSLPAMAYYRTLERVAQVSAIAPEVLDLYDFDKAEKETALADGLPPEYIRDDEAVEGLRQARAEAQQQAAQMAQAEQASVAAKNLGSVPANSSVGEALRAAGRQATTPGIPQI